MITLVHSEYGKFTAGTHTKTHTHIHTHMLQLVHGAACRVGLVLMFQCINRCTHLQHCCSGLTLKQAAQSFFNEGQCQSK